MGGFTYFLKVVVREMVGKLWDLRKEGQEGIFFSSPLSFLLFFLVYEIQILREEVEFEPGR